MLKKKMEEQEEFHKKMLELTKQEFQSEKDDLQEKINLLEKKLENIENFIKYKSELENEKKHLTEALDKEKKDK